MEIVLISKTLEVNVINEGIRKFDYLFLFMTFAFIYIIHELLDHRLKQLNIGRSCWTQVEVTGLKVETADFYVEVSLFLYFHLYYICIA